MSLDDESFLDTYGYILPYMTSSWGSSLGYNPLGSWLLYEAERVPPVGYYNLQYVLIALGI